MHKKIFVFICLIIGISFIIYLNNSGTKNDRKVTIQFSSWGSESEIKILKPIIDNFENENPDIKVDFMHIPQNYFQKIHLLFASNTAPDVIFINNQYLPIYADAGVLEELNQYEKFFEFDKFYPKALQTMTWNNKLYAVPRDISNLIIFYNKDLFRKYNVPFPNNNWTFDDFLKTAKQLTHTPDVYGISFEEEPLFYLPYLTSNGLNDVADYDNVKNNPGLKFYSDLRNKHHVAPLKQEAASATMAQLFLQEKIGMHLSGRWMVPKYRQDAHFDWDIIAFPRGNSGSIVPMDSSGWAIAKSSKHKPESIKLIKFLASEQSENLFAQSGLIVPARIDSANSKYFLDGEKPYNSQVFLSAINTSVPTKVTVNYRKILDNLKLKTENLFNYSP